MDNDKGTGSGSKWFLFIESLRGLMNSRISTEYVSIESGRDPELLIVIFQIFYKFPYRFLYYLDAIMGEMRKRGRHLVQYFCQWFLRNIGSFERYFSGKCFRAKFRCMLVFEPFRPDSKEVYD